MKWKPSSPSSEKPSAPPINQQDPSRPSPLIAAVARRRAADRDRLTDTSIPTEVNGRFRKMMHGSGS